jgi:hypothetical protein
LLCRAASSLSHLLIWRPSADPTACGEAAREGAEVWNAALVLIAVGVLFLADSIGANDNLKGVASLFGSGNWGSRQNRAVVPPDQQLFLQFQKSMSTFSAIFRLL